jgi:alpha-beta hydrolase superfamily lysophospholipase
LVIAHSLGSVIAFDMLTREDTGPGPDGLTALVTCGSPLAWPTIRHSLGQDGALELPDGIDWLNLHAAGDLVAQSGLGAVAPAVRDELVRNGITDPHTAVRYLEKQPLADLIVRTTTA